MTFDDLDNSHCQCKGVSQEKMHNTISTCISMIQQRREVGMHREIAQDLSQNLLIPYFFHLSFGGNPSGIFGSTPFELLHTWLLGLVRYSLKHLYGYSSWKKDKNGKTSHKQIFRSSEFERRVRILSQHSKRQSDRQRPRSVFNVGVTQLSGIQGQEYIGLSILTIIALPGILRNSELERKFSKLLWWGISMYSFLSQDEIPKNKVFLLQHRMIAYLDLFDELVGPQREKISPSVGNKFPKRHGALKLVPSILEYGSAQNINGLFLESHLKTFMKRPAKRTRKTHQDFSLDLSNRWSEHCHIDRSIRMLPEIDTRYLLDEDGGHSKSTSSSCKDGKISLTKAKFRFIKVGPSRWRTKVGGRSMDGAVHPHFQLDPSALGKITQFLTQTIDAHINEVNCHYELRTASNNASLSRDIFCCNPSYRGKHWFDWINVRFMVPHNRSPDEETVVPARVYLWLSFGGNQNESISIFGLVCPTQSHFMPSYSYLPSFPGDYIGDRYEIVDFSTVVSCAYVLPGVGRQDQLQCQSDGEVIHNCTFDNKYFLSIPEQSQWPGTGWEEVDQKYHNKMATTPPEYLSDKDGTTSMGSAQCDTSGESTIGNESDSNEDE